MAVSVGPTSGDSDIMLDVNTTPLIDVMLVLLVMLIITIPIQTHAIKIDLPPPNRPPPPTQPVVVNVFIDFDHTISWNGSPVTRAQLDADFYYVGQKAVADQEEIHIDPDANAIYGDVAMVMADAQRHGAVKLGIVGTGRFPEFLQ